MGVATEETQRNTQSLKSALDSIFLAIGNAYYEANKAISAKAQPVQISVQSNQDLKQGRSNFLDSLDQLEIIVMRATEVVEACARRRHPELFGKQAIPLQHKAGPSPESMLLNGEGLIPTAADDTLPDISLEAGLSIDNDTIFDATQMSDQPDGDSRVLDVIGDNVEENKASDTPQGFNGLPIIETMIDQLPQPISNNTLEPNTTFDEDIMNLEGPIDFGDMDFENFNFDETAHFDFGTMMED